MAENLVKYNIEDGYVVYQRKSTVPYFEMGRQYAETNANVIKNTIDSSPMFNKWENASKKLQAIGQAEFNREQKFLNIFLGEGAIPDNPFDPNARTTIIDFVSHLNVFLTDAEHFELAKNRLKIALSDKGKKLAPVATSILLGKIFKVAADEINKAIREEMTADDNIEEFLSSRFDKIWSKSIEEAVRLTYENPGSKTQFEAGTAYKEFYDAFKNTDSISQEFKALVNSRINLDKIKAQLKQEGEGIAKRVKALSKKPGTQAAMRRNISDKFTGSFGGSINEYVNAVIVNEIAKKLTTGSGGMKNLTSNMAKTDNIGIFTIADEFSADPLLEEINKSVKKSHNLEETAGIMEDLSKNTFSKLKDVFVVYESDKAYALGESFDKRGFSGGEDRPIIQLLGMGRAAGIKEENLKKLIGLVNNTIPGAIFESENDRKQIKESLEAEIAPLVANMLFDDWVTLGNQKVKNVNTVHIFNLDGVYIPLSLVLLAAGKAIDDLIKNNRSGARGFRQYFSINLSRPESILYREVKDYPIPNEREGKYSLVENAWRAQAEDAKQRVKFGLHFLGNFKQKVKEWCGIV